MSIIILNGYTKYIREYGIDAEDLFRPISFYSRLFRVLSFRLNLFTKYWLNNLEKITSQYSTILLFDCPNLADVCASVEKVVPLDKKLILFFWNPVSLSGENVLNNISNRWSVWTFDPEDSIKYGLKYGGQFIFDRFLPSKSKDVKVENDVFFIGLDKGRFSFLRKIEIQMRENLHLSPKFMYVDKIRSYLSSRYCKPIPYDMVLEDVAKSKAILEINQSKQAGLTLRTLEALFLERKLITNNHFIKMYSFYNPNNIYIYNNDDTLVDFLERPYVPYNKDSVEKYKFINWLTRIVKGIEFDDYFSIVDD